MTVETTQTSPSVNAWALPIAVTTIQNSPVEQTTAVYRSGLCAMVSMTAGITVMNRIVRPGRADLLGNSAATITAAFLFAGNVMDIMTVVITQMRKTVPPESAQRVNFDAVTRNAFPLDGCVTVTMTVRTTRMSAIVT